jgi:hypothetical protein
MTELYILLTGIGIGSFLGFALKMYCCIDHDVYTENDNNENDIDVESERNMMNDTRGYIHYLESILNNSTNATTTSVSLQPIDISFNNITSDSIFVVPHSPTQMMPPTILTPRFSTPSPSAPFAPVSSDVIYIQDENIVGDTVWRDVDHNDRV